MSDDDDIPAFSFYTELESADKASGVLIINVDKGENILTKCKKPYSMFSLRVQVGEVTKAFRSVSHNHGFPIWNEQRHIAVTVYANPENPMNRIVFTLFAQGSFPGEESHIIGMVQFHLHDVIRAERKFDKYRLTSFNKDIGLIGIEMKFFYGRFGYGHSLQLEDEVMNAQMQIKDSLYPVIKRDVDHEKKRNGRKQMKWFSEADRIVQDLSEEKNVRSRIAKLRQIVNGEFASAEIPLNFVQVEHSRLTKMEVGQNRDLLVPVSLFLEGESKL